MAKPKQTPRARFIAQVAELAGQLYDRMDALSKREIERVKRAAADALREQLVRVFAKDEVTIVQAREPIDTGLIRQSWPDAGPQVMNPNVVVASGGGVRVELVETPEGPALEVEDPSNPMPTEGTCVCGVDFAELRARGETGHACFGRESSRGRPRRVANRRRNATAKTVVTAGATHGIDQESFAKAAAILSSENEIVESVKQATSSKGSGKPPELGMRSRESIRMVLDERARKEQMADAFDGGKPVHWNRQYLAKMTSKLEAEKHAGVNLEDVDIRSTWVV